MDDLQNNVHTALMCLATDVMDGKYGRGNDFDITAFVEDHDKDLEFILEDGGADEEDS